MTALRCALFRLGRTIVRGTHPLAMHPLHAAACVSTRLEWPLGFVDPAANDYGGDFGDAMSNLDLRSQLLDLKVLLSASDVCDLTHVEQAIASWTRKGGGVDRREKPPPGQPTTPTFPSLFALD